MEYLWIPVGLILGIAMVQNPELVWEMQHILTVKDGEPTEFYLRFTRIGGIVVVLCSILMLAFLMCS